MKKFVVLFEKSNDGYAAYVPDLPGCVAIGDTKDEAEELIYDAIKFHIEGLENDGESIPQTITDSEIVVI
jgi:predicted RNase H-like HicB family nuclease